MSQRFSYANRLLHRFLNVFGNNFSNSSAENASDDGSTGVSEVACCRCVCRRMCVQFFTQTCEQRCAWLVVSFKEEWVLGSAVELCGWLPAAFYGILLLQSLVISSQLQKYGEKCEIYSIVQHMLQWLLKIFKKYRNYIFCQCCQILG